MKGKWFSLVVLMAVAAGLLSQPSCARSTKLVSISIQPPGGTFGAVDNTLYFQFKALGSYIHPPKTVDITNQVNWQSDNPEVIQITGAGVASPNTNCGVAQVFAEMHQDGNDVVSNSASITVDGPASEGCTPAGPQPILTVDLSSSTTPGTVTSSPTGIDCSAPSACSATFTTGTTVTLTGTPTGTSTSVTWKGCSTANGTSCMVILENSLTVTAAFN